MPDINDIHRFYEANLPGYLRMDILEVNKFFLNEIGLNGKKPIRQVLHNFQRIKDFVVKDWQGEDEIREVKLPPEKKELIQSKPTKKKRSTHGKCKCGGVMIKKQNRADKSFFLGCSNWPKCTKTKPFLG